MAPENHQKTRKRRMSATPTRTLQDKINANLIAEEAEELDLDQSLLTLQLKGLK